MVKNFWNMVELYCGNHNYQDGDEIIKMTPKEGPLSLFYSCPKYYPENRDELERACANRLDLVNYEKMIDHLSKLFEEAELNGSKVNFKNHKWKEKGIEYEVFEHTEKSIKVKMINRKALK